MVVAQLWPKRSEVEESKLRRSKSGSSVFNHFTAGTWANSAHSTATNRHLRSTVSWLFTDFGDMPRCNCSLL